MSIKVVGFDADDTLWINENYFREGEKKFCELMNSYLTEDKTMALLYDNEMNTLDIYGFGIKGFVLSMIETASQIMKEHLNNVIIDQIVDIGKEMLNKPVELFDGVEDTLKGLQHKYRLILVTKGDLLDQERKLEKSGITRYFHHVEVMSNKHEADYLKLIKHLDIDSSEFLMIGNSLRSDILPVTKIGSKAVYIPYDITWQHETVDTHDLHEAEYETINKLPDVLTLL
ncbi:MAG: HAD family hydrolase [Cyclobacteriaceae bacterium]|nr:HAD family hydrolase [Cyclobacteriaceae bacterium]